MIRIMRTTSPEDQAWLEPLVPGAPLNLEPGESVFRQGDPVSGVFRVTAGRVRLKRHLEDGSTVAVHTAAAGETFAEAALFAAAYHCDAVAETPAEVLRYDARQVRAHLARDPAAAMALARALAGQVRDLRGRLELRNIRSARERVTGWLRLHAHGSPPTVVLRRPWMEVAAEIGLSREALYRALAELVGSGVIRRDGERTVLLKP